MVQKTKYTIFDSFFVKCSRDNFSIILIDLYHMGIFGEKKVNGKYVTISLESVYKSKKNNRCKLEEIKNI